MDTIEDFIHDRYGYCFYSVRTKPPLVYNLYVEPAHRGKGHARRLLAYVVVQIRETGHLGEIEIEVAPKETAVDSQRLAKFYRSLGLTVIPPHSAVR